MSPPISPPASPPISIVVPTRNRPAHLRECLTALAEAVRPGDEIVVADSASTDPAVAGVAAALGVRSVRCDRPGASRARNAGARAAAHDVVVFVDDDVRVEPGWAAAIAAPFADPGVGFVTGRVSVPPVQEGYQRPVAVSEGAPRVLDADTASPGNSANLAVRRVALEAIGGFDEALGGGARFEAAEDLDLFDRLFAAGWTGRYEPAAVAYHDQWRTRRQLLVLDWRYGIGAGARLAKLARTDRRRARLVVREVIVRGDLATLWRVALAREEFAVLTHVIRLVATVPGLFAGLVTPVRAGRFD